MRAALLAVVAACGSTTQAPPPPISNVAAKSPVDVAVDAAPMGGAEINAKMTQFTDEICKCTDRACTDRVTEEITQWEQEKDDSAGEVKLTVGDIKQMLVINERLTKCVTAVMMYGPGSGSAP